MRARLPTCRPTAFKGDVSEWGRKVVKDFYTRPNDMSSEFTMSSGLSPRGDAEHDRPFDVGKAKASLMYNAAMYGKAQQMRKAGQTPAAMGVADDLPNRFAYHQLNQLSGMADKVRFGA